MTTPKVKIRKINKTTFHFTFWKDGKRTKRQTFHGTKRDAELLASHYQLEILSGKYKFLEKKQIITLPYLIDEFLRYKKNELRNTSFKRYENYLGPFKEFL
jgi:hypothetical protein